MAVVAVVLVMAATSSSSLMVRAVTMKMIQGLSSSVAGGSYSAAAVAEIS